MKLPDAILLRSARGNFEIHSAGESSTLVSCNGETLIDFGRIAVGDFSEASALPEKMRLHETRDRFSADIEAITAIPFGCEYHVRRVWTILAGMALLNCDITADNGGAVGTLELEPVRFPFAPAKVEYIVYKDPALHTMTSPSGILYQGAEPPFLVRVFSASGAAAEFYAGDDFWRHRAGSRTPGAHAEFILSADASGVTLRRKVLILDEGTEPVKRPWRFKSLLAWRDATPAVPIPAEAAALKLDGCFAAAAPRRQLRDAVRRAGTDVRLTGDFPSFSCDDPAHLERPGKAPMEHGDLGELVSDYLWANRELNKRGKRFFIECGNHHFGDSAVLNNLARPICPLED